jgi:2-C-methyl-D-erythritol 4-phosphate cytidylyltransferase / 2-C-methyl-D-erythritol 2,4-cyclodiphosphate synthase
MKVVAAILCAGRGTRYGRDKVLEELGPWPVWQWSYQAFASHDSVRDAIVVCSAENRPHISAHAPCILGGATRQESSLRALQAVEGADVLLIHDGARPFVTEDTIQRVIDGVARSGAAAAALPVTDTIKRKTAYGVETLNRDELLSMQTPQGARTDLLRRAHAEAGERQHTDDMALLEAIGVHPAIVDGDPKNFKITTAEDMARARALLGTEVRTGIGYDIHAFSDDPQRKLMLGGAHFEGHRALAGHSDADVLLHAIADAILGAAGLRDIGQHFPNTDPAFAGAPSLRFVEIAAQLVADDGWRIENLDCTLIGESPKVMKRWDEIRANIAGAAGVEPQRVNVKATTNEGLGSIGRGEGISAFAVATLRR